MEHLTDNHAALLLYAADELSPAQRAKVERSLAADPALQHELESIRQAEAGWREAMEALDGSEPIPGQHAAVRRVVARMRQYQLTSAARRGESPTVRAPQLPLPWWAYPSAAAASILVAFATWVVNYAPSRTSAPARLESVVVAPHPSSEESGETDPKVTELANSIESSFGAGNDYERNDRQLLALRDDPLNPVGNADE